MTIHRYDHCPNSLVLHDEDIHVEWTEEHGLEFSVMIENYSERVSYEERVKFLSREEALELANFILEELGTGLVVRDPNKTD